MAVTDKDELSHRKKRVDTARRKNKMRDSVKLTKAVADAKLERQRVLDEVSRGSLPRNTAVPRDFMNISKVWSESDKDTFAVGLKKYAGQAARRVYADSVGLTQEHLMSCSLDMLVICCNNMRLKTVVDTNSSILLAGTELRRR
eukprot:CAMPEP_0175120836 /NCGR_PEP_ID=MMETSP0087-20121206/838_1 /TAXON_ID=136419 /ORGANISM="Unknown Unknown, Strain D1" /LENGTH=143 /DNA_ID=CAMNT_0016402319 /DNA_START=230 /DNA_END=657 /DNA_ORIENTATION=-